MSYGGYSYGRSRRRRSRLPLILGVVLVLIVAAAAVAVYAVKHHQSQQRAARARSLAQANAVVHSFLTAYAAGDTATMAADATPDTAALVTDKIPKLRSSLKISKATYTPGAVNLTGIPGAGYHASVTLQGLGSWTYDARVHLQQVNGQWRIQFTPQTIYPGLEGQDKLVRTRTVGTRGRITLADGTPLLGRDVELDGNMLGSVGKFTATQARAAGALFQAGDVGGQTGLERAYNAALEGTPGGSLTVQSGAGKVLDTLIHRDTTDGKNVAVSFDLGVQRAAETALAPVGQNASLVAIDVRTGKVLAVVNHPLNGYGRAIRGHYPPGSTFKIITTTAALMSGRTPSTILQCPNATTVGGRTFGNAESEAFGPLGLRRAFVVSCNTAFINLEAGLPVGAIGKAAALYGFSAQPAPATDSATSGPLPLTSFGGSVPAPKDAADGASEAIGQGRIVTSPLQMAGVAAAVASGVWRQPFVSVTAPKGNPSHTLPGGVAATLQDFMGGVVAERGGTAAKSGLPAGTHGKTGTAEVGSASPPATTGWFVGYRGNIAFACQVGDASDSGGFGADVAAPAVARFLTAIG